MATDVDIQQKLIETIRLDTRLSGQPIELSVHNGFATLEGTVQSYRRKLLAEKIVASVDGCQGVENRLTVEPITNLEDGEIAKRVRESLDAQADIPSGVITVAVIAGKVELRGSVTHPWERVVAEDVVLGVRGVRDVENLILVDPGGEQSDEALSSDLQLALQMRVPEVRVAVCDGHVVLSGAVSSLWQKEIAEGLALSFPVISVRNEIVVRGGHRST